MPYKRQLTVSDKPVSKACIHCRTSKLKCDEGRPCKRCIATGKQDSCVNYEPKPRGRRKQSRPNNFSAYNSRSNSSDHHHGSNGGDLHPQSKVMLKPTREGATTGQKSHGNHPHHHDGYHSHHYHDQDGHYDGQPVDIDGDSNPSTRGRGGMSTRGQTATKVSHMQHVSSSYNTTIGPGTPHGDGQAPPPKATGSPAASSQYPQDYHRPPSHPHANHSNHQYVPSPMPDGSQGQRKSARLQRAAQSGSGMGYPTHSAAGVQFKPSQQHHHISLQTATTPTVSSLHGGQRSQAGLGGAHSVYGNHHHHHHGGVTVVSNTGNHHTGSGGADGTTPARPHHGSVRPPPHPSTHPSIHQLQLFAPPAGTPSGGNSYSTALGPPQTLTGGLFSPGEDNDHSLHHVPAGPPPPLDQSSPLPQHQGLAGLSHLNTSGNIGGIPHGPSSAITAGNGPSISSLFSGLGTAQQQQQTSQYQSLSQGTATGTRPTSVLNLVLSTLGSSSAYPTSLTSPGLNSATGGLQAPPALSSPQGNSASTGMKPAGTTPAASTGGTSVNTLSSRLFPSMTRTSAGLGGLQTPLPTTNYHQTGQHTNPPGGGVASGSSTPYMQSIGGQQPPLSTALGPRLSTGAAGAATSSQTLSTAGGGLASLSLAIQSGQGSSVLKPMSRVSTPIEGGGAGAAGGLSQMSQQPLGTPGGTSTGNGNPPLTSFTMDTPRIATTSSTAVQQQISLLSHTNSSGSKGAVLEAIRSNHSHHSVNTKSSDSRSATGVSSLTLATSTTTTTTAAAPTASTPNGGLSISSLTLNLGIPTGFQPPSQPGSARSPTTADPSTPYRLYTYNTNTNGVHGNHHPQHASQPSSAIAVGGASSTANTTAGHTYQGLLSPSDLLNITYHQHHHHPQQSMSQGGGGGMTSLRSSILGPPSALGGGGVLPGAGAGGGPPSLFSAISPQLLQPVIGQQTKVFTPTGPLFIHPTHGTSSGLGSAVGGGKATPTGIPSSHQYNASGPYHHQHFNATPIGTQSSSAATSPVPPPSATIMGGSSSGGGSGGHLNSGSAIYTSASSSSSTNITTSTATPGLDPSLASLFKPRVKQPQDGSSSTQTPTPISTEADAVVSQAELHGHPTGSAADPQQQQQQQQQQHYDSAAIPSPSPSTSGVVSDGIGPDPSGKSHPHSAHIQGDPHAQQPQQQHTQGLSLEYGHENSQAQAVAPEDGNPLNS